MESFDGWLKQNRKLKELVKNMPEDCFMKKAGMNDEDIKSLSRIVHETELEAFSAKVALEVEEAKQLLMTPPCEKNMEEYYAFQKEAVPTFVATYSKMDDTINKLKDRGKDDEM